MSRPALSNESGLNVPPTMEGASERAAGPTLLGGTQSELPPSHPSAPLDPWGSGSDQQHWELLGWSRDPFTFDLHEREAVLRALQSCQSFNRDADVDLIDWSKDQLYRAQMAGVNQQKSLVYIIWARLNPEMRQYALDNGLGDPQLVQQPGFTVLHLIQRIRNICGLESRERWGARQLTKLQQRNQESFSDYSHRWSNIATAAHGRWENMSRLDKRLSFLAMRNGLRSKAMSLELATNPPYHSTLPGFHQWLREVSENLVLDTHKHVDNLHTITSHAYLEGRPPQDQRQRVNQMN